MKDQEIITCPNCGSNKVKKNPFVLYVLIGMLVLFFIPVLGWLMDFFLLCLVIAVWIIKKWKKIEPMKCKECKHPFQVKIESYKQFKSYIKAKASV